VGAFAENLSLPTPSGPELGEVRGRGHKNVSGKWKQDCGSGGRGGGKERVFNCPGKLEG
jgi:hypothetical protein